MTTLAILSSLNDAFLLRSMLEANEIPVFIPDENACQNWGYIAVGGVRVQVSEEFVEKAKSVLAQFKDKSPNGIINPYSDLLEETASAGNDQTTKQNEDITHPGQYQGGSLWLVLFACAVVGVFLALMIQGQIQEEALHSGYDAYNIGDYDAAIADYGRSIQFGLRSERVYFNRGDAYAARGDKNKTDVDYDQAIADFSEVIKLNSKSTDAYNNRGITYEKKGDYDKAIMDYEQVIEINPDDAEGYCNLGSAYLRKGNNDKAIAYLNQACQLDPSYEPTFFNRGYAHQQKHEYTEAIENYKQALLLNPKDYFAYCNRGNDYDDLGEYDLAIADYNQALQVDPKFEYAYADRGKAYADKGDNDKAIADYNRALQLEPKDTQAYFNRGGVYQDKGEYDKAIADYSRVIQIDPNSPQAADAYCNRALTYQSKGAYDKAIMDCNQAILISPKHKYAYSALAWLLATCPQVGFRDGQKAVEAATKGCELTEWKDPDALDTLAAAYAEAGDFINAVKWERQYLETTNLSVNDTTKGKSRLALYQAHKPYHADK